MGAAHGVPPHRREEQRVEIRERGHGGQSPLEPLQALPLSLRSGLAAPAQKTEQRVRVPPAGGGLAGFAPGPLTHPQDLRVQPRVRRRQELRLRAREPRLTGEPEHARERRSGAAHVEPGRDDERAAPAERDGVLQEAEVGVAEGIV